MTSNPAAPSLGDSLANSDLGLSVTDKIASQIRDDIIQGKLAPGMALIENELTVAYSVSRNTLREALRQVCREGLASHFRHRGVIVRTLSLRDVRDIYRVRRILELQAVSSDAPLSRDSLAAMNAIVTDAEAAAAREDWRSVGTHSLMFHQQIVRLLGSALVDEFFKTILAQLRLVFAVAPIERQFQQPWIVKDRRLFELLRAGNNDEAAKMLTGYLDESERALLDIL
jgi:DNA-binding GntR family transcriptional regulator